MNRLGKHIEALLLENDCVIIPDFGGFITCYTPASYVEDEHTFSPPVRSIGFNPQLKLNDGLLVQAYMDSYSADFSDAVSRLRKDVEELVYALHAEGKVRLGGLGELCYDLSGNYNFIPHAAELVTPSLYGLASFELQKLSALPLDAPKVLVPGRRKRVYKISYIRNAVASVIAIVLFFSFSIPVKNTDVSSRGYAQLLPNELFKPQHEDRAAETPMPSVLPQAAQAEKEVPQRQDIAERKADVSPLATAHEPQQAQRRQSGKAYHIIVAGGISLSDANQLAEEFKKKGFPNAQAIKNGSKARVSILSFDDKEEANSELMKLRGQEAYRQAWLLPVKSR